MKKLFKFIFAFLLSISFCYYVKADSEDDLFNSLHSYSQEDVVAADNATKAYCSKDGDVKGCVYDLNDPLYTKLNENVYYYLTDTNQWYELVFNDVPLSRGYQAFNGKGEGIFVGCYKYYYDTEKDKPTNKNYYSPITKGTVFIFKFVYLSKASLTSKLACNAANVYVVPAQGVKNQIDAGTSTGQEQIYPFRTKTEQKALGKFASFEGWTATENGECPNVFAVTSNAEVTTKKENMYIFANRKEDFYQRDVKQFWGSDPYVALPGCLSEDNPGINKNQELLTTTLQQIEDTECPTKIEEMSSFEENLNKWYSDLADPNNNEFRELWSKGLSDRVNAGMVQTQINDAFVAKINECKYNICELTNSEREAVEAAKGNVCKNGCTFTGKKLSINIMETTDPEKGKCYLCGRTAEKDGVYYFLEKEPEEIRCEYVAREQDKCFGTPSEQACLSCYTNAYKKANLSTEKQTCMLKNDLAASLTVENFKITNQQAATAATAEEVANNEALREEMFNRESPLAKQLELFISSEQMLCSEILGPVISQVVKGGITIIQIVGAIIAIVKGMLILVPAVIAKDADALKKASKTLVTLAIILVIIILLRPVVRIIGNLLEYDTSCIL